MNKSELKETFEALYDDIVSQIKRINTGSSAWDVNDVDNWTSIAGTIEVLAENCNIEIDIHREY